MVSKRLYILSLSFFFLNLDARCVVFFTPRHDVKKQLLHLISREKSHIQFALYYLTEKAIIDELKRAQDRGVLIEAIIDQESFSTGNNGKAQELVEAGMDIVKFETPGMFRPLMHNKFFIFDGSQLLGEEGYSSLLWTGSYNGTARANRNCENVLIIDEQEVIDQYKEEFLNLRKKRGNKVLAFLVSGKIKKSSYKR